MAIDRNIYAATPENLQKKIIFPVRMWVSFRRRVLKLIRGRGRLVGRLMRKVVCVSLLQLKKRGSSREHVRRGGRHVLLNYDLFNYSKNFDDGVWQQEEEFYRSRSFAYRFGQSNSSGFQ